MMRINEVWKGTADIFHPLEHPAWILYIQFFALQIDFIYRL
jgi:hypothetical protein